MTEACAGRVAVTIGIPVLNESKWIRQTHEQVSAALEHAHLTAEIIIVDDGSTDSTCAVVRQLQSEDPRVILLRHPRNLGFGAGVKTLMAVAQGDYVMLLAGDNSFGEEAIRATISEYGKADLICGWRRFDSYAVTPKRRMVSNLVRLNLMIYLGGTRIDPGGMNMIRTELFKRNLGSSNGFMICFETLGRIGLENPTIAYTFIHQLPGSGDRSTSLGPKEVVRVIGANWRLAKYRLTHRKASRAARATR